MARASFHTLGCKLNYSETATIARQFAARGFEVVPFGDPADVVVINTCTVTEKAEQKCRNAVRRSSRLEAKPFIVVTGCYAQLRPDEIAEIPGVDLVLGTREKFDLFKFVTSLEQTERTQVEVSCIDDNLEFGPSFAADERTRAFLKVQDGCDYTCSFCTIPMARGKSRSAAPEIVLDQVQTIAEQGFLEIVLSGVNVGLYGQDSDHSLIELLQTLDQTDQIARFRVSSIEPNLLSEEIVDFIAGSSKFVPHFHLPLQSGSDRVLAGMRRRYRSELYQRRVEHILQVMPDACIGGDVIVGFPGESEDAFLETVSFLEALPISYLHVFTYSERPGTVAQSRIESGDLVAVPKHERSRRNRVLRQLSERKRRSFYTRFEGERKEVLWESGGDERTLLGFTDNYIRTRGSSEGRTVGELETVRLDRVTADGIMNIEEFEPLPISLG